MRLGQHLAFLLRFAPGGVRGRGTILAGLLVSALAGAASTGFVALINRAIHVDDRADAALIGIFVAVALLIPLTSIASVYLLESIVRRTQVAVTLHLSAAVVETPLARLEEIGIPRILSVLTSDARVLGKSLSLLPSLVRNAIIMAGCMTYMLWLSPRVFLLVAVLASVGVLGYRPPQKRGRRHLRDARRAKDDLYRHYQGLTEGAKEVKLHRARSRALVGDRIGATSRERMRHELVGSVLYSLATGWGQIVFAVLVGLLLFAVPAAGWQGGETLTGYVLAGVYFFGAMEALLAQAPSIGRATVAIDNIVALNLHRASRSDTADASAPASERREAFPFSTGRRLELQDVRYRYSGEEESERFELGPVDLTLESGEVLFLVGGNGSGKTTLAKILTGLYEVTEGSIVLDGVRVDGGNRHAYRELFSAVFSDFFLFDSLLGQEGEQVDDRARLYLSRLRLDHKVTLDKGHWSTVQLSQGQRKRLALLVAFLEDRPFYLFDEWAADQDPQFRELFYLEILPDLKLRGKAVIVISHDDRYYGFGDCVIKLNEGRIESRYRPAAPAVPTVHSGRELRTRPAEGSRR